MQEAPNMSTQEPEVEVSHEEWGDGRVVSHWSEGGWVMYDPEDDTVSLDEMR